MRISCCSLAMIVACASPPNTCDQHVIDHLAAIGFLSANMAPNSQTAHTISSFDCDGGGTATMDVTGWSGKWAATFTFDDCTIGASPNVLTVNGTLDYHNGINDDDGGRATGLSISGTIDGCATTIAETCDLSWYSEPKEPGTNYNYYRFGMLCGRQFP